MRVVDELLKDEKLLDTVYMRRKANVTRKVGFEGVSKRRQKWPCAC